MTAIEKAPAYWLDPDGGIIPIGTHHIDDVIRSAQKYGLDQDEIKAAYAETGEPMGLEGKAREKIMLGILKKGWTRVRYNGRSDSWNIQVWDFKPRDIRENIWDFLVKATESGLSGKYADVRILSIKDDEVLASSSKAIMAGVILATKRTSGDDLMLVKYADIAFGRPVKGVRLGRILDHMNSGEPFAVMSAWRSENSREENDKRQRALMEEVRRMGYGYIMCYGKYIELAGDTASSEDTIFIPGIPREEALALGKRYGQESILAKDDDGFDWVGTNNEVGYGKVIESFNHMRISQQDFVKAFSRLRYGNHSKFRFQYYDDKEDRKVKSYLMFRSHVPTYGGQERASGFYDLYVGQEGVEFDSFSL